MSGESDKRPMQKTLVDPGKQLSRHEFESRHIQCVHLIKGVSMRNQFRALTVAAVAIITIAIALIITSCATPYPEGRLAPQPVATETPPPVRETSDTSIVDYADTSRGNVCYVLYNVLNEPIAMSCIKD